MPSQGLKINLSYYYGLRWAATGSTPAVGEQDRAGPECSNAISDLKRGNHGNSGLVVSKA